MSSFIALMVNNNTVFFKSTFYWLTLPHESAYKYVWERYVKYISVKFHFILSTVIYNTVCSKVSFIKPPVPHIMREFTLFSIIVPPLILSFIYPPCPNMLPAKDQFSFILPLDTFYFLTMFLHNTYMRESILFQVFSSAWLHSTMNIVYHSSILDVLSFLMAKYYFTLYQFVLQSIYQVIGSWTIGLFPNFDHCE